MEGYINEIRIQYVSPPPIIKFPHSQSHHASFTMRDISCGSYVLSHFEINVYEDPLSE
jgi:hypothetical protein